MKTSIKFNFSHVLCLFCIIYAQLFYCQKSSELDRDVKANGIIFSQNLDKAFQQIDPLIKKASDQKNYSAELILMDRKCRYYYSKNQIDKHIDRLSVYFLIFSKNLLCIL